MPYINTKTNISISNEKCKNIKQELGKAITIIPGKSENWLMVGFEDNLRMFFKGDNAPTAFIEIKSFGKSNSDVYNKLTAAVTEIINKELDIEKNRIYVKYEEVSHWGYNGSNF